MRSVKENVLKMESILEHQQKQSLVTRAAAWYFRDFPWIRGRGLANPNARRNLLTALWLSWPRAVRPLTFKLLLFSFLPQQGRKVTRSVVPQQIFKEAIKE